MIRYIIVDDDIKTVENVKRKIDVISKDFGLVHKASYNCSKKAFQEINQNDFDLLIVDYNMPVYNGLELAQKIARSKKIIFLTATTNNEKKIINNLDVSGFLNKPLDIEEFKKVLKNKIICKINKKTSYLSENLITLSISKNKEIRFSPNQVYFISTALISTGKKTSSNTPIKVGKPKRNHVNFYGKDSVVLFENVRLNINDLAKKLNNLNFKKINQSTIVNAYHIKERDNLYLKLHSCKEPFEISKNEKNNFIKKLKSMLRF